MSTGRKTILLFSLEPWGAMWYSKHHYAAELAKDHTVYFISPPDKWRPLDLFSMGIKVQKTPEGVTVVNYRNNLPLRILPRSLARWMYRITARKLARLLEGPDNLLWAFHATPIVLQEPLRQKGTCLIYHIVDPYEHFEHDTPCAQAADLVVVINTWFKERYRKLNPHTIMIPHGVRALDREQTRTGPNSTNEHSAPYVILAGGINAHINYALLIAMAHHLPDLHLVLAGPLAPLKGEQSTQRSTLIAMNNVIYAGVLPQNELSRAISSAVAGLVAYDLEPAEERPSRSTRTPLKVINYLAQLKPVVTTINCYIPELDGKAVYKVDSQEEFLSRMQQVAQGRLGLDEDLVHRYLDRMSYPVLIGMIFQALGTKPALH